MRQSLYANAKTLVSRLPSVLTDGTVNGTGVSWQDCRSVMAVITVGTITDGTHTVEIQHSDVVGSGYAAVPDAQLVGTEPALTSTNDDQVYEIGYKGSKQFLRAVIVTAGSTLGGIVGANFIKAFPYQAPLR